MRRRISILLVPHHSILAPWRLNVSLSFLTFLFGLWTGLTVWAGWLAGRNVDYWATKAHNEVMRRKMEYFAGEFDRTRDVLAQARETDERMRVLLGMKSRKAIIETGEAVGGPGPLEKLDLASALSRITRTDGPAQPDIRREAEELRGETQKRLESFREIAWYIASQRSLYRATPAVWPASGRLTSGFGYRLSPFQSAEHGEFHHGIDIANEPETPIVSTADGVVRYAGWQSGYGRMVLVDHGFGFSTLYGHTSRTTVRPGQAVRRGDVIAHMGTSGRSTGEHLHYEVWRFGKPVNPREYLTGRPESVLAGKVPPADSAAAFRPFWLFSER